MTTQPEPTLTTYSLLRRQLRDLADQESDSAILALLKEADTCLTRVITTIAEAEAELIIQSENDKRRESV
jgi:hypothetical protein